MQKKTKQQTTKMQTRVMSNSSSLDAASWKCHIIIIAIYLSVHTTHELREGNPSFFCSFLFFFYCGTWSCKKGWSWFYFVLFLSMCFIFVLPNQVVFVFLQNIQHPLCLSVFVFCPLLFFFFFFFWKRGKNEKKTHLHTHAHTHACMHAHTHARTHPHTLTHTYKNKKKKKRKTKLRQPFGTCVELSKWNQLQH